MTDWEAGKRLMQIRQKLGVLLSFARVYSGETIVLATFKNPKDVKKYVSFVYL